MGEFSQHHQTKILTKSHMESTQLKKSDAEEIEKRHGDFQNARNNSVHIEDQITRSVNNNLPRCLSVEESEKENLLQTLVNALENDDGCTGEGECCRWERKRKASNNISDTTGSGHDTTDPSDNQSTTTEDELIYPITKKSEELIQEIIRRGTMTTSRPIPRELKEAAILE